MQDDLKKKKVNELKKLCKEKIIKGYSKFKNNEIIEKILQLYVHETQEITNEQIEHA